MSPEEQAEHRRVWKSLPKEVRWALIALEMVKLDEDTGVPVLMGDAAQVARALAEPLRETGAQP